jgi:cell division control protein 24
MVKEVQAKREERHQNGYKRGHGHERDHSLTSSSVTTLPAYSTTPSLERRVHGSYSDLHNGNPAPGYWDSGPQSAHPHSSEFYNEDDTENEGGYSHGNGLASESGYSGRNTPSGLPNGRRGAAGQSMPPERESPMGYGGHRTRTEDPATFAQWASQRQNGLPANPSAAMRPPMNSRNMSTASGASGMSMQSEASFGNGISHGNGRTQPGLRSQFSASRLRAQHDGYDDGPQSRHNQGNTPRMRAISNPTGSYASQQAYNQYAPPVPIAPQGTGSSQSSGYGVEPSRIAAGASREMMSGTRNQSSMGMRRPISGGSSDTDNSGEQSPENGPLHHVSTTAGGTLRGSRSQIFNGHNQSSNPTNYGSNGGYGSSHPGPGSGYGSGYQNNNVSASAPPEPPVKIKVYWLDDLFVIMVPRSVTFTELVQRVQKKIRLCGGGNTDGPLRLKYDDEDGDRISLSTDEELQMAFDMTISRTTGQGQLILRVN